MKKINFTVITLALLAFLMMTSSAQAAMSVNISYSETALGGDLWQYDFTLENTSSNDETYQYLSMVSLDFEEYANVTILNTAENWTIGTFTDTLYLNDTAETDYLELYSDAVEYDVLPGGTVGLSFTADYQIGEVSYTAFFSDSVNDWDWQESEGMASPVPVPAAVWLLGSGLLGLAGIRRKSVK